jgi:flagellar capping protein FliD
MNDQQYGELLQAIVDLRQATELGLSDVDRRFDKQEEHWNRRFNALEARVEDGFRQTHERFNRMDERFNRMDERFNRMEERFCQMNGRFDRLEQRIGALELRIIP